VGPALYLLRTMLKFATLTSVATLVAASHPLAQATQLIGEMLKPIPLTGMDQTGMEQFHAHARRLTVNTSDLEVCINATRDALVTIADQVECRVRLDNASATSLARFCGNTCQHTLESALLDITNACNEGTALWHHRHATVADWRLKKQFVCTRPSAAVDAPYCLTSLVEDMSSARALVGNKDITDEQKRTVTATLDSVCSSPCKVAYSAVTADLESNVDLTLRLICAKDTTSDEYCMFTLNSMLADFKNLPSEDVLCSSCFQTIMPVYADVMSAEKSEVDSQRIVKLFEMFTSELACTRPNNGPTCIIRLMRGVLSSGLGGGSNGDNDDGRRRLDNETSPQVICSLAGELKSCCAPLLHFTPVFEVDLSTCEPAIQSESCTNTWNSTNSITFPDAIRQDIVEIFDDDDNKADMQTRIRLDIATQLDVNKTTINITGFTYSNVTGELDVQYEVVSGQDSFGLAAAAQQPLSVGNLAGFLAEENVNVDVNDIESEFRGEDPGERPTYSVSDNDGASGAYTLAVAPLAIVLSFAL